MPRVILIFVYCIVFSSCSLNWPHRYDTIKPSIMLNGPGNIVVLAKDKRPSRIKGKGNGEIVGTVRAVLNGPWDMTTANGKPFSQVFSAAVCNAFVENDFSCTALEADGVSSRDALVELKKNHPVHAVLYFTIKEWHIDVYTMATARYDFELNIFDENGVSKALATMTGEDQLSVSSFLNPAKNASIKAPVALKEIIELMLNDKKIVKILN